MLWALQPKKFAWGNRKGVKFKFETLERIIFRLQSAVYFSTTPFLASYKIYIFCFLKIKSGVDFAKTEEEAMLELMRTLSGFFVFNCIKIAVKVDIQLSVLSVLSLKVKIKPPQRLLLCRYTWVRNKSLAFFMRLIFGLNAVFSSVRSTGQST